MLLAIFGCKELGTLNLKFIQLVIESCDRNMATTKSKKVILITGCDSGFGYSLACHMADHHGPEFLTIACSYEPNSEGSEVLRTKPNVKVLPLDVTNEASVQELAENINSILDEQNAQLWAVVNNAATLVFADATWQTLLV